MQIKATNSADNNMVDDTTASLRQMNNVEKTLRPEMPFRPDADDEERESHSAYAYEQAHAGGVCPNCGAEIDGDADYCESCHSYIKKDVCSFCGAHMDEDAAFCPECGSSRDGIVCPVCHKMNEFAFCKQCGQPLTDEAKALVAELSRSAEYIELNQLVNELSSLDNVMPYKSDDDVARDRDTEKLRVRVLELLAKDRGIVNPVVEKRDPKRMTEAEMEKRKAESIERISKAFDRLAQKPCPSPVKARNYVMATKPAGVRVAWLCNYKHALHSSPCGCAKPHLGGKWVVMGRNGMGQIKDDN